MYAMYPETSDTLCDARCNTWFGALQGAQRAARPGSFSDTNVIPKA